jgi:nucleoside-diphosphate-sugar epimerase
VPLGDLRNPGDVKNFCREAEGSMLIHCAGIVHPRLFVREFYEVNVAGTRNLLQAAAAVLDLPLHTSLFNYFFNEKK